MNLQKKKKKNVLGSVILTITLLCLSLRGQEHGDVQMKPLVAKCLSLVPKLRELIKENRQHFYNGLIFEVQTYLWTAR